MATRQYIGARYVPKFYENSVDGSTQWESNVVYDPLIYVTLQNGHMYISKKQVPATVGTPASNVEYWLDVGSYEGYIEDLQNQITALDEKVDDEVARLDEKIEKRYIFLFDSYGNYKDSSNHSLMDLVAGKFKHAEAYYRGGIGFTNANGAGTFTDLLTDTVIATPETVTDIVVCGGQNDYGVTPDQIRTAMQQFIIYANTRFPNAKISIGHTSSARNSVAGSMRTAVNNGYIAIKGYRTCVDFGAFYLNGVEYIMHSSALYTDTGMTHPNATGVVYLARGIVEAVEKGMCQVSYNSECTPTPSFGSTYSDVTFSNNLIKMEVYNGVSILRATPTGRINITRAQTGYAPSTEFLVGIIDPSTQIITIVGDDADAQYCTFPATAYLEDPSGTILGNCPALVRLNSDAEIRIQLAPGLGTYNSSNVKVIRISNFGEVTIDSTNC